MTVARTDLSIMAEFGEDMKVFVQELAYSTAEALAIDTPVDSGKARSNTVISPVPSFTSKPAFFDYGRSSGENKSETLNLKFTLNALRYEAAGITAFQDVYIMNNAANNGYAYAGLLDEGFSLQTPAGMVDRAIFFGIKKAELKLSNRFTVSIT